MQETSAAATASKLYVIGGYSSRGTSVSNVFVYYGARWVDGPTFPIAVNHPAAATLGGAVYVTGGFTGGAATNRAFVLVRAARTWKEIARMRVARAAAVLLPIGGYLYAIGGLAGSTQIAEVERYDPAANVWSVVTRMPRPRNHLAGYVDGNLACVVGGREPTTSNAVDCLNTKTKRWKPGIPIATPTSGPATGIVNGVLVVAGGESSGETSLVPVIQELRGISWTTQPMLTPRHGTGYAQFEGRLGMCGGATAPGYQASATCSSLAA